MFYQLFVLITLHQLIKVHTLDDTAKVKNSEPSLLGLDTCQYLKNISDVETMNQHQYEILEQCLYYYLAAQAQHKAKQFSSLQALAAFPPSYDNKLVHVKINFNQITLQHFVLNEFLRDLNVVGYIDVTWVDDRLSWSEDQWKLRKFEIHSINHIWVPMFTAQSFDRAIRNGDTMEVRRAQITSNGTVHTIVNFSLRTFCDDSNFQNFPDDVYKCCFQLEPHFDQDSLEFVTDSRPVFTDPKSFRDYGWFVSGTTPTAQIADETQNSQLGFCINLQRSTSSVRIELSLPSTVTAILFLLTPLLGQIHFQLIAKVFILLMQFVTMQLFAARIVPHLGSASATPKILQFLEFAITINTISICASVFLWMCSRVRRNLPPWRWLIRVSEVINRCFCVFNAIDLSTTIDANLASTNAEKGIANNIYQSDWTNAFVAVHGVTVCSLSLIFIFGYILIL